MINVSKVVGDLFSGYANGIITDRELGDMVDLVTNTYTTVIGDNGYEIVAIDEKDDDDYDWSIDQDNDIPDFGYDLEASQYDYI